MISSSNFRYLLLYLIFGQLNLYYVKAAWPLSNSSNIQILGLFDNLSNRSESSELSVHSRAMFRSAVLLSQQHNITIEGQFIGWQSAETNGNIIHALSKTCQALSYSNIVGIIGPGLSREAHLIADFGKTIGIPVISYSVTDPDLSNRNVYRNFYRTVPSDNSTALAIVKLFLRFNWTSCIVIYQNDAYGSGGAKIINEALINNNLFIEQFIIFDITTVRIRGDLKSYLINSPTRIVILWIESKHINFILENAIQHDLLAPQFTWILSSSISLKNFNKTFHEKLIGLFSIEPVTANVLNAPINMTLLNSAYQIWQQYEPETFPTSKNVNFYALFAFDATWTLIKSLEKICSTMKNNSYSCLSFIGSSFCFHRRFVHSDLLLNALCRTDFLGVSGPIKFNFNVTDRIIGSYYYAQNVQPSENGLNFVPVLEYSDSTHWKTFKETNVIIWPGNSLIPPTGRAVLKGISLRIGVVESIPFTIVTNVIDEFGQNTTKLTGYVPDLIELLADKIGFIPNIQLVPINQTYSGLIQEVVNGHYDIVIGDVTVTSIRRELVGFSNAIFDNSLRIIMRKTPGVSIELLSFLKPFSNTLWLLVLGACVYAGLLICLIETKDNEIFQNRSILSKITMSIWYSFGNIVGYGVDFHVNTAAGRVLTAGLYMLSLILVATYTANLASDLTISKSKDVISSINDIKNGKIPFNRIGMRIGTAGEDYYLREISSGSRNYYPLKSRKETYDSLLAGIIDASFMDIGTGEYITNNIYCNLTLIEDDFDKGVFGIVTPKEWLYAKDLDVNILLLRESGQLDDLRQKWFRKRNCPSLEETSAAMEINSMSGLFLIFALITLLSLLLFIWSKRFIIKSSLLNLLHRKKFILKKKTNMIKHSSKESKHNINSVIPSSTIVQL
ncbi:unnamed protein product [Rotaria sp. Silwood2]|nr:unnamed protein product [Rotaria sp. Silwood2]CAF3069183.1 unnamed protein product [Rotaria sp. Silwood2]CAF3395692.1 unnamed protein product [Rotaria sp. Silwood2]CAF4057124.1 unnamed protein product [Rotaria sp. Silwood2]CAF4268129.1 unnamed protein product [Rotaria sp. Silwood2]